MIENFTTDPEVTIKVDVLNEFQKNQDLEYKYSYKRIRENKRLKKPTVDGYGFDNPESNVDDYDY